MPLVDGIDYGKVGFYWDIAQGVFLLLMAIYTYVVNRTKANQQSIKKLESNFNNLSNQVKLMERELKHLPDDQAIAKIHNRIDQVGQGVKHLEGQLGQINNTVSMIQQYLLENKS